MKKWILNNLGLKLMSLAIGFVIWLVIMNVQDPVSTSRFTLDVDVINSDILADQDMTYEVTSGDTITITVRGKTSVISDLKTTDFVAKADLSKLSIANAVPIEVSLTKNASQVDIETNNAVLNVELEKVISKDFKISFNTLGTEEDGYYPGDISGVPNIITVSGSESRVNMISRAVVTVNIAGASDDLTFTEKIHLVDDKNNELSLDKYTLSSSTVSVSVNILKTKTIPVKLEFSGEPAEGYAVTGISFAPKEIMIAGEVEDLKYITELDLGACNISGEAETKNVKYNVNDYLPSGVKLVDADEHSEIAASITIEKIPEMQ